MTRSTLTEGESNTPERIQIKGLLDFINRLGNASRGLGAELDQYLRKIKSASQPDSSDYHQLPALLHEASLIIQNENRKAEHLLQHTHEHLRDATRQLEDQLLKKTGLKKEQQQLQQLIEKLDTPLYSYLQMLDLTKETLALYQQACTLPVQEADSETTDLYVLLQSDLASLLASVEFHETSSYTLQDLRQRLSGTLTIAQLIQACIESLQLVIRGINDERHTAQEFLLSLEDSLESVYKALGRALYTNDEAEQQQRKMDEKVGEQLTSISDSVHNTQSLPELKRLIIHHLQLLNTAMNDRQHQENEQRKFLTAQLTVMQARLEDVENEAQNYKRRLSDQKFKSLQDSLTRLPNRTAFEERLRLEFQRWQNYATPLCVVIVDIDHFKRINDSYGHTAGDKTLQVIANTLKKSLRQTDFVCRYGGEEFVIVMPQTSTETACELLEKARHRIKSIPFKFKNTNISITMSAGVSCFVASDTPTTVFERADRALYDAKNQGRDRVRQL